MEVLGLRAALISPGQLLPSYWAPAGPLEGPGAQRTKVANGIQSGLCVWHPFSSGDIKNPDITSLLSHQKGRPSPCTLLQRADSCGLCGPGRSRKSREGNMGSSPNLGDQRAGSPVYHNSPGTVTLVTTTAALRAIIMWAPDKQAPQPLLTPCEGGTDIS